MLRAGIGDEAFFRESNDAVRGATDGEAGAAPRVQNASSGSSRRRRAT